MTKTSSGNFFEDFRLGQTIRHATPPHLNGWRRSLYTALFGGRFAVQSSAAFAKAIGYQDWPVDDLLVFHIVFGKNRAGRLAQCCGQPWLRRDAVSGAGVYPRTPSARPPR